MVDARWKLGSRFCLVYIYIYIDIFIQLRYQYVHIKDENFTWSRKLNFTGAMNDTGFLVIEHVRSSFFSPCAFFRENPVKNTRKMYTSRCWRHAPHISRSCGTFISQGAHLIQQLTYRHNLSSIWETTRWPSWFWRVHFTFGRSKTKYVDVVDTECIHMTAWKTGIQRWREVCPAICSSRYLNALRNSRGGTTSWGIPFRRKIGIMCSQSSHISVHTRVVLHQRLDMILSTWEKRLCHILYLQAHKAVIQTRPNYYNHVLNLREYITFPALGLRFLSCLFKLPTLLCFFRNY